MCYNEEKHRKNEIELEDVLLAITKAMEYQRLLRIIYEKDGEFTERVIRPYYIKEADLYAYCCMRHGKRRFRLENIIAAVMLPEKENL